MSTWSGTPEAGAVVDEGRSSLRSPCCWESGDPQTVQVTPHRVKHRSRSRRSVKRIVGPDATGEVCDIVIETRGEIPFVEGQSYGVIPPGTKVNSRGKEVSAPSLPRGSPVACALKTTQAGVWG